MNLAQKKVLELPQIFNRDSVMILSDIISRCELILKNLCGKDENGLIDKAIMYRFTKLYLANRLFDFKKS